MMASPDDWNQILHALQLAEKIIVELHEQNERLKSALRRVTREGAISFPELNGDDLA
jgi:hypothetical protein